VRFGWVNSDGTHELVEHLDRSSPALRIELRARAPIPALHLDELPIGTSRPTAAQPGHLPAPRTPPPQRAAAVAHHADT